jgi:Uma2 family endonuclease
MSARKPKYQTWGSLAIDPDYRYWDNTGWKIRKLRPYSPIKQVKLYTCEEYLTLDLPEGRQFELRDGKIYMLAAPLFLHADVIQKLYDAMKPYFKGKKCTLYNAAVNIRLKPQEADKNLYRDMLVPDLVVICDKENIHGDYGQYYEGAPPFIIEVLSPSTAKVDKVDKRRKYEEAGVKEYWIVSPHDCTVETFVLKDGRYEQNCYGIDEENMDVAVPVTVFPGLVVPLRDIFTE